MIQTHKCLNHGAKQKPRFLLCELKKAGEGLFQQPAKNPARKQ